MLNDGCKYEAELGTARRKVQPITSSICETEQQGVGINVLNKHQHALAEWLKGINDNEQKAEREREPDDFYQPEVYEALVRGTLDERRLKRLKQGFLALLEAL